jgi:hypothetical protein
VNNWLQRWGPHLCVSAPIRIWYGVSAAVDGRLTRVLLGGPYICHVGRSVNEVLEVSSPQNLRPIDDESRH